MMTTTTTPTICLTIRSLNDIHVSSLRLWWTGLLRTFMSKILREHKCCQVPRAGVLPATLGFDASHPRRRFDTSLPRRTHKSDFLEVWYLMAQGTHLINHIVSLKYERPHLNKNIHQAWHCKNLEVSSQEPDEVWPLFGMCRFWTSQTCWVNT